MRPAASGCRSPEFSTTPVTGTYVFYAPGRSWDASDNGTYTATIEQDR